MAEESIAQSDHSLANDLEDDNLRHGLGGHDLLDPRYCLRQIFLKPVEQSIRNKVETRVEADFEDSGMILPADKKQHYPRVMQMLIDRPDILNRVTERLMQLGLESHLEYKSCGMKALAFTLGRDYTVRISRGTDNGPFDHDSYMIPSPLIKAIYHEHVTFEDGARIAIMVLPRFYYRTKNVDGNTITVMPNGNVRLAMDRLGYVCNDPNDIENNMVIAGDPDQTGFSCDYEAYDLKRGLDHPPRDDGHLSAEWFDKQEKYFPIHSVPDPLERLKIAIEHAIEYEQNRPEHVLVRRSDATDHDTDVVLIQPSQSRVNTNTPVVPRNGWVNSNLKSPNLTYRG